MNILLAILRNRFFLALACAGWVAGGSLCFGACSPAPAGLVSWWPGDSSAQDISGTNHGTFVGAARVAGFGQVGSSFFFSGTNDYVRIADSLSLRPSNLTVEAWVWFRSLDSPGTAAPGQQYIVFKQNARNSGFEGFTLNKARGSGGDYLVFGATSATGIEAEARSTTMVSTGRWYHVAGVRGSNYIQIHVNGRLEGQTPISFPFSYTNLPVYLGSSGQSFWDRKLSGYLDELALYNRALSTGEVAAIYAANLSGKCKYVEIVSHPQSQTVAVNQDVSFSVQASGFGMLAYQWQRDGMDLPGFTNSTLALSQVQPGHSGGYRVVVTNKLGAATSEVATLTVVAPPIVVSHPQSLTVTVGAPALFSVNATGGAPLIYQWRLNGMPLGGASSYSFLIPAASVASEGAYDVVVSNGFGASTSLVATLTVLVPPSISLSPADQTVIQGARASFSVHGQGTSPLNYQWRRNGQLLEGATASTYVIDSVQVADSGVFDVVLTNVAGSITSAPATLWVQRPPEIIAQPSSLVVTQDQAFFFAVGANGTEPMSYQWRLNGTLLSGATGAVLSRNNARVEDAGTYDVVVSNAAGVRTSAPASLTVYVPAFLISPPADLVAGEGESHVLQVLAGGTAPISYQWRFNSIPIPGQTNAQLDLEQLRLEESGWYDVWVTNVAGGFVTAPIRVTVVGAPTLVGPFNTTNEVGSRALFEVEATSAVPLRYQWRFNGVPIANATNHAIEIGCVLTNHAGWYQVDVDNGFVFTTVSASLSVFQGIVFADSQLEQAVRCALGKGDCPVTLSDMQGLQCLDASGRQIIDLSGLQHALNLRELSLADNRITNLALLQPLSKLEYLDLARNRVSGLNPIGGLTNLTALVLDGNPLLDHAPISGLKRLKFLSLFDCLVEDIDFLQPLIDLRALSLRHNRVSQLHPLVGMANLEKLDLRWNAVARLDPILGSLTNLTELHAGGNMLARIPALGGFGRLQILGLEENWIRTLEPETAAPAVRYLNLSRNSITNYTGLNQFSALTHLEVTSCGLQDVALFGVLTNLEFLDLSFNQITNAGPLANLPKLESLVLNGCPLAQPDQLNQLPALTSLWMPNTGLSEASFLSAQSMLKHVNLDGNQIADLAPLAGLARLEGLSLAYNPVTDYSTLGELGKLRSLRLAGLCLESASAVAGLTNLAFLSLNGNQIADVTPLISLTNLEYLYLERNRLTTNSGLWVLSALPKLWEVDLSKNAVEDLSVAGIMRCSHAGSPGCDCPAGPGPGRVSCLGRRVTIFPPRKPPVITLGKLLNGVVWYVDCGSPVTLAFEVLDDIGASPNQCDRINVTAVSSDPQRVVVAANPLPGSGNARLLTIQADCGSTDSVFVTVRAQNSAGLVSFATIEVKAVEGGPVVQQCPNIEPGFLAMLAQAAGVAPQQLTPAHLLMITNLSASRLSVGDPCAWRWLTNLNTLNLALTTVSNLDFLPRLPALETLGLAYSTATNLWGLTNVHGLHYLDLSGVGLVDVTPILGFSNTLVSLNLGLNRISDIQPLAALSQLRSLGVQGNRLGNLNGLAALSNLNTLWAYNNFVTNMAFATNLPGLLYLEINGNLIPTNGNTPQVLERLRSQGVLVEHLPQRRPAFDVRTNWVVAPGGGSTTSFTLSELEFSEVSVVARTGGGAVVPSAIVATNGGRSGRLTVTAGSAGSAWITLVASNDAPFAMETNIFVEVTPFLPVDNSLLNSAGLVWTVNGDRAWFGQGLVAHDGVSAAQSGAIADFGRSVLSTSIMGPGRLSFWWKVSSEVDYDWLEFYLNDVQQQRISGDLDWREMSVELGRGSHSLRWVYSKDKDTSLGSDAAWVDEVRFQPRPWLEIGGETSPGLLTLILHVVPGIPYALQRTTDWLSWSTLATGVSTTEIVTYVVDATSAQGAYYRLVQELSQPSRLRLESVSLVPPVLLSVTGTAGTQIDLQSSTNLSVWTKITTVTLSNTPSVVSDHRPIAPARFYRLAPPGGGGL